jgi:hypothetical protein
LEEVKEVYRCSVDIDEDYRLAVSVGKGVVTIGG